MRSEGVEYLQNRCETNLALFRLVKILRRTHIGLIEGK